MPEEVLGVANQAKNKCLERFESNEKQYKNKPQEGFWKGLGSLWKGLWRVLGGFWKGPGGFGGRLGGGEGAWKPF